MTRRGQVVLVAAALIGAQLIALGVHRLVERDRRDGALDVRFDGEALTGAAAAPAIVGRRAGGDAVALAWPAPRHRLVHFWATWCAPCRDELPALLAAAGSLRAIGIDVEAVVVDDTWPAVTAFFDGEVPDLVLMPDDPAVSRRYGVSTLPDTYLVSPQGWLRERYAGARAWTSAAARHRLGQATQATPSSAR